MKMNSKAKIGAGFNKLGRDFISMWRGEDCNSDLPFVLRFPLCLFVTVLSIVLLPFMGWEIVYDPTHCTDDCDLCRGDKWLKCHSDY